MADAPANTSASKGMACSTKHVGPWIVGGPGRTPQASPADVTPPRQCVSAQPGECTSLGQYILVSVVWSIRLISEATQNLREKLLRGVEGVLGERALRECEDAHKAAQKAA
eukprot:CAMPEP_0114314404 /NCGR_PEP_ID=MMETSP0059-20121206/21765_1 /TAXON_ID=36894 /ORGANISM="Pyramimonas parkeae, Strain CCMP726" /LENGTH=110 /DNA_ID=CAMNT_0001439493 /DNA_START=636 /DNA_END=965 /DNA_ORIENTATION=+